MLVLVLSLVTLVIMGQATNEALQAITQSADSFSNDLFKEILKEKPQGNVICSTLSAHLVLSMAAYGARGNTLKQMGKSLYLPKDFNIARQGFQSLLSSLQNVQDIVLKIANKIYIAKDFDVDPRFQNLMPAMFKSEISVFDTAKTAESVKSVNQWVENQTNNKIHDIIKSDDVNSNTHLMLLNAVYFKGSWAQKFNQQFTSNRPFHVNGKTKKNVPTMFMRGSFKNGLLPELEARFIELPYKNKELKMVIILPNKMDGLSDIEKNLSSLILSRLAESNDDARGFDLYLPRFKIETTIDLQQPLQKLGMGSIFGSAADFSGIAKAPLKIGKVLQKAFIEVNEEGSEAAAATETEIEQLSGNSKFDVNHPFAYQIVKEASQNERIVLFSGVVREP
ncbi:hypothetical protein QAD02_023950 [Eretmocerus hayati]|uniref:Uncharacterized protein n=1 Tax=Eretmocerus hayati TaxID=131215 RepID=A0ACC2Q267_9HYME|nr:hypothetical protein QAD02_023950 [Eretmocerus hayati]